jgi:hypothetical protein
MVFGKKYLYQEIGAIWVRYRMDIGSIWDRYGMDIGSIWDEERFDRGGTSASTKHRYRAEDATNHLIFRGHWNIIKI